MFKITEKVHHGQYLHAAWVTVSGIGEDGRAEFNRLIDQSPYYPDLNRAQRDLLWRDLIEQGRSEFGWSIFTAEPA